MKLFTIVMKRSFHMNNCKQTTLFSPTTLNHLSNSFTKRNFHQNLCPLFTKTNNYNNPFKNNNKIKHENVENKVIKNSNNDTKCLNSDTTKNNKKIRKDKFYFKVSLLFPYLFFLFPFILIFISLFHFNSQEKVSTFLYFLPFIIPGFMFIWIYRFDNVKKKDKEEKRKTTFLENGNVVNDDDSELVEEKEYK